MKRGERSRRLLSLLSALGNEMARKASPEAGCFAPEWPGRGGNNLGAECKLKLLRTPCVGTREASGKPKYWPKIINGNSLVSARLLRHTRPRRYEASDKPKSPAENVEQQPRQNIIITQPKLRSETPARPPGGSLNNFTSTAA